MTMDQVDVAQVAAYAGEDADAAWRLEAILAPKVREEGLWDLYADLERPLIASWPAWRRPGSRSTWPRCGSSRPSSPAGSRRSRPRSTPTAGREFNIGSGPQLRQVLFDELKLPVVKKTPKGEPSTDAEVLEELAAKHPLPRLIVAAPPARQAQEHLPRRPADPGPRGRPGPRLVQPGGRRDRPAQLQRPEPPEHPDPDRGRPPDPPGVRRRASRAGRC